MEAKVRFKNKISEPLMTATDFGIKTRTRKGETVYSLEFTVCKSMGVSEVYSFDSTDEKLLRALLSKIEASGEFLFDEACKVCDKTALDYDRYVELAQSGEIGGELKFGDGGYVITVSQ
ncbi:MAG: hypothetical protein FWD98_00225 [Defluviitaleaceae bacterium]|nr:hypothetical protein [Defluviitaleaceae bacterium]